MNNLSGIRRLLGEPQERIEPGQETFGSPPSGTARSEPLVLLSKARIGPRPPLAYLALSLTIACLAGCPMNRLAASSRRATKVKRVTEHQQPGAGPAPRILRGHRELVAAVAFSPDGRTLATGSADYTAKLWDTRTWRPVRALRAADSINGLAFAPDGAILAIAARDAITLWDASNGQRLRSLAQTGGAVAFSPDGKLLAALGAGDYAVRIWHTSDWRRPRALGGEKAESLAFSPDGSILAVGGVDRIDLWDTTAWTVRHTLRGQWGPSAFFRQGWAKSVAFSRDGSQLAAATQDSAVHIWSTASWTEVAALRAPHGAGVYSASFSPDGRFVAAGCSDGNVLVWNVATSQQTKSLWAHAESVLAVAISHDGKLLASGGSDGLVAIWQGPD